MQISSISCITISIMNPAGNAAYSREEIVDRIIRLTEGMANFWASPYGWASIETADLLTKSRLDWQVSLTRQLSLFLNENNNKESGALILSWVTLGSLVEGAMKLFLSVWYKDYRANNLQEELKAVIDKNGDLIVPGSLVLEKLRIYFSKRVFPDNAKEIWRKQGEINWTDWVLKIQQRRNAIHTFNDREIGTIDEFYSDLKYYLLFLRKVNSGMPYPGQEFIPSEV